MRFLAWMLALFAAAVALAAAMSNPGYVMLVYPPYRAEFSLTLFVILLLLAIALCYGLIRLVLAVLHLPAQVRQYRLERAQARSRERLEEVLSAFFEGRYAAAEKAAAHAMEQGETSALYPIIAARSAHELREFQRRDAYLSSAEGRSIGDSTMRLMATSKFMLDQQDPAAALNALQQLRDSGVKGHPGAMTLELKAQQQAGNWDEVLSLLDQIEKRGAIDAPAADQVRQQAWLGKIRQQPDLASLTACLKTVPAEIRKRSAIAAAAGRALMPHGGCTLAHKIISDSLDAHWDSDLVAMYGDCQHGDVTPQIEQAEKWLAQHKQDAGLMLALGKLCMHQKLWGKARSYLDASISIAPSHAAYNALGQLAEQLGKPEEAFRNYQNAMALAAGARIREDAARS